MLTALGLQTLNHPHRPKPQNLPISQARHFLKRRGTIRLLRTAAAGRQPLPRNTLSLIQPPGVSLATIARLWTSPQHHRSRLHIPRTDDFPAAQGMLRLSFQLMFSYRQTRVYHFLPTNPRIGGLLLLPHTPPKVAASMTARRR
jgi:hypothetical protein